MTAFYLSIVWLVVTFNILSICWDLEVPEDEVLHYQLATDPLRILWLTFIWDPYGYECAWLQAGLMMSCHLWLRFLCWCMGHRIAGCGYGGPESGNDDHECTRCGEYWHVPLY